MSTQNRRSVWKGDRQGRLVSNRQTLFVKRLSWPRIIWVAETILSRDKTAKAKKRVTLDDVVMVKDGHSDSPICPPKWTWLLAGFAIGLFTSFLVYLKIAPVPQEVVQIEENTSPKLVKASEPTTHSFDDMLPAPDKPTQYILQVGSFRDQQQADGLKTYLKSLDISAMIKKTGIWHQVQVGPFTKMDQVNKTRDLLSENKINVILQEQ